MPQPLVLPEIDELTAPFWRSGADGTLRIQRCRACGYWIHPPKPRCRMCMSPDVGFEPVVGRGEIWSFTVNRQAWSPDLEVPYVTSIVELPEQAGLRLTTRLVDVALEQVRIELPVEVVFEPVDDLFIPYFTAV